MIGQRLIDLRKDAGLTQKELSEKLFVNYRTYSGYERNEIEPGDDFKIRVANFYNISIDYLLGLSDNPHPIRDGNEYIRMPKALKKDSRLAVTEYISFLLAKDNQ